MLALLKHPHQMQHLRNHPGLLDAAIDELLRYDSPVKLNGRSAREGVGLGGKRIRAGDVVISVIGAANRDPEVFENPDGLDIGRRERAICPSGAAFTTVWAHRWRCGRRASRLPRCWTDSPRSVWRPEPRHREAVVVRGVEHLWIEVQRTATP